MGSFVLFDRDQAFLLPPDLKAWLPEDDVAHFIVAATERVRIERATYRDVAVRFVAGNRHPDHDTLAAFRQANRAAIKAALLHVLLLARAAGLLRLGTVSIDGTKLDADASKFRYDRAKALPAAHAQGQARRRLRQAGRPGAQPGRPMRPRRRPMTRRLTRRWGGAAARPCRRPRRRRPSGTAT